MVELLLPNRPRTMEPRGGGVQLRMWLTELTETQDASGERQTKSEAEKKPGHLMPSPLLPKDWDVLYIKTQFEQLCC